MNKTSPNNQTSQTVLSNDSLLSSNNNNSFENRTYEENGKIFATNNCHVNQYYYHFQQLQLQKQMEQQKDNRQLEQNNKPTLLDEESNKTANESNNNNRFNLPHQKTDRIVSIVNKSSHSNAPQSNLQQEQQHEQLHQPTQANSKNIQKLQQQQLKIKSNGSFGINHSKQKVKEKDRSMSPPVLTNNVQSTTALNHSISSENGKKLISSFNFSLCYF